MEPDSSLKHTKHIFRVAILLAFVLGLTFWVGWTIATVEVEAEPDPGAPSTETEPASDSDGSV